MVSNEYQPIRLMNKTSPILEGRTDLREGHQTLRANRHPKNLVSGLEEPKAGRSGR
jgi:hypothetical protein